MSHIHDTLFVAVKSYALDQFFGPVVAFIIDFWGTHGT